MKKHSNQYHYFTLAGLGISVLPPLVATLCQFPGWINTSAQCTFSGVALLCILISIIPLLRILKQAFASPSCPLAFGLLAAVLLVIRSIVDQVLIVSIVGFISGLIGWLVFKLRDKLTKEEV